MTLRLKRHRETEDTLARVLEQRDVLITKLVRNDGRLKILLRAKARLEKAMAKTSPVPASVAEGKLLDAVKAKHPVTEMNDDVSDIPFSELPIADSLEIPTFLRRKKQKAKAADKLAAMPLTGKAALEAVRHR